MADGEELSVLSAVSAVAAVAAAGNRRSAVIAVSAALAVAVMFALWLLKPSATVSHNGSPPALPGDTVGVCYSAGRDVTSNGITRMVAPTVKTAAQPHSRPGRIVLEHTAVAGLQGRKNGLRL